LYPLDLSSAHENINNLDNLVECFFGTDLGDLGRVGAGSIRMSPIGTDWGAAEMDWHAVLGSLKAKLPSIHRLFGGSFHISMIRRSIWASALPPFTARVVVPNASLTRLRGFAGFKRYK